MSPAMNVGDIAIVRESSADSVKISDIVSYEWEDGVEVLHRLVEITPEGLFIKGDANPSCDPEPVRPDQIKGRVVFIIPKLGWVGLWLKGVFS